MDVFEEIEKREKRLNAIIEIAEDRLKHIEELGVKAKGPQIKDYSAYYVLITLVGMILGTAVLVIVSRRIESGIKIPIKLYVVLMLLFAIPVVYYLLFKRKPGESPGSDLVERERMARTLLERFYKPLKEAVQADDKAKIEELANRLLEDPILASSMEILNEGDPKVVAYALLLYARYEPGLENEVKETLSIVTNKPAKALLETLLRKGYNPQEQSKIGGDREA
ncbi:hypothetical membrane protein, conserved [Thermococcus kodakarensis KOD1]|uniref:Hypothetical membrane protein, conserved n=1 Tax=Thermococcus kodakarensis (strain ATCC BAA-918 / JCM 12380 / KOD1) TaxID=69014 RepID=Q5JFH1_THEKO|nr:hypothetical protein [Thermococcus kodakarensis]WCN28250.1 hypothetical protein POG15_00755 [Thermococcus kodakarensis]WCN30545.1 hypothetical protein POG21_00755 [Thermococcus kodakarensis]BAD84334.1 hypothetical membrane protein, conserved [Thermococcus kodakarensis KOD1]